MFTKMTQKQKKYIHFLLYCWRFPRDIPYCLWNLHKWHYSWRLYGKPLIQKHRSATIRIGNDWIACSDPRKNSMGVFQKVTISALNPNSILVIGDNVGMSGVSICCDHMITIRSQVLIGSGVLITDNDAHPLHFEDRDNAELIGVAPVVIEDGVFVGARSIILKGVTIGHGSVIGAGSVVTKNVPPLSIAAGNPAKVIGAVTRKKNVLS